MVSEENNKKFLNN